MNVLCACCHLQLHCIMMQREMPWLARHTLHVSEAWAFPSSMRQSYLTILSL